jgi:hypothetical protein
MKLLTTLNLFIVCAAFIFLPKGVLSQDYSQKYLISDGLPSQEIYDLYQDKNGVLWIASDRGIASFNGIEFTSYSIIDGLPSNMVFEFFEQSDGTIWCTTRECRLFYFHPDTLVIRNYKYNDVLFELFEKLQKLEPRGLVIDPDGGVKFRFLWRPGLVSVSPDGKLSYKYVDTKIVGRKRQLRIKTDQSGYPSLRESENSAEEELEGFKKPSRNHLLELDNSFVRLSESGYQIRNKSNLKLKEHVYLGEDARVLNSGECQDGFWMGLAHDGVKVFDENGRLKNHLGKQFSITTYLEDADGGIWLGTHGSGLLYYAKSRLKVFHPSWHTEVRSLSADRDSLIYITNHRNVVKIDENLRQISKEKVSWNKELGQYYFWNRTYYDPEELEVDDYGEVVRFSDNRYRPPLFCYGRCVKNHEGKVLFIQNDVKNRLKDAEFLGNQVVACYGKNVALIDMNGIPLLVKDLEVTINELDIGEDGLIYCATRWKGVIILNQQLQVVSRINTLNGMLGDYVFEVYPDGDVLWIGTDNGLCKATKQKNNRWKCDNVSLAEGLPDVQVYDIEVIKDRVYVATREGISYFDKKDWRNIVQDESRIYFKRTKLMVNGVRCENLLNLSHDENQIEIDFSLVTFVNYRKLNFRYKLKGFDEKWQVTSERKVLYHSLPPGNYEFIVQPVINDYPREETLHEKISILPAFYNRWWFHLTIWSTVLLVIWFFFKYRILNYNQGVIQEILRQVSRRLRPSTNQFVVKSNGRQVSIVSEEVVYVESSRNYITIYTENSRYIVRKKISDFVTMVPDPREYVRIKRSLIVRIDKVTEKGVDTIVVRSKEFKVGKTYLENLKEIEL